MNLTIVRIYDHEVDYGDPMVELVDNETGDIILSGDYYHDKIEQLIEGFICGLEYVGLQVNKYEVAIVDESRF